MSAFATLAGMSFWRRVAQEAETGDPWLGWKWANFAILAAGLGYLIRKHAPAFFEQRSLEIRQGIAEATKAKQEAEARAAAMERRLASLESEIASLRAGARGPRLTPKVDASAAKRCIACRESRHSRRRKSR